MAIKLKCHRLGISLEFENTRGKKISFKLVDLINKICDQEKEKNLKELLHWARDLRNYFAHPDRHSFIGGIAHQHIVPLINGLNLMFWDTEMVVAAKEQLKALKEDYSLFHQGLFVLEREGKRYLISNAIPLLVHEFNGDWLSCWSFMPVLTNVYESFSNHCYTPPIVLNLSSLVLTETTFTGKDVETGTGIVVSPTSHPLNQEKLAQHESDWNRLEEKDRAFYRMHISGEVTKKMEQFQYKYCWN